MVNRDFWKGKRVFITGHTGFKGSWLSLWLQSLGAEVTGYSLAPPTDPSLFVLADLAKRICSIEGDIRNFQSLLGSMHQCHPEVVIHMAAQAIVRKSYKDPLETYSTNIMGTVNLLEAIRRTGGVKVAVNVTSDKCYENKEWLWGYRETDPMGGFDPYASSKGCAELITAAYRRSFFNPSEIEKHGGIASVRAGNVIGGGDWAEDRLIPDIMTSFLNGKPVLIRFPKAIRPWQHVLDPLSGYLLLVENLYKQRPEFADSWNFGPSDDDAKPVSWIVEHIVALWGNSARFEIDRNDNPHEATYLKLDCTKAKNLLGWKPRIDIHQALDWTVSWYKQYKDNPSFVYDFTLHQIHRYEKIGRI